MLVRWLHAYYSRSCECSMCVREQRNTKGPAVQCKDWKPQQLRRLTCGEMSSFSFHFLLRRGRHDLCPEAASNQEISDSICLKLRTTLHCRLDSQRGFFLSIVWKCCVVTSREVVRGAMTSAVRIFQKMSEMYFLTGNLKKSTYLFFFSVQNVYLKHLFDVKKRILLKYHP